MDESRQIQIEKGYHIIMNFFGDFWIEFLKPMMIHLDLISPEIMHIPTEKDDLHVVNALFFECVCMGYDCIEEFSETLTKVLGIPREKQPKIIVSEEQLFEIAVEFCKMHHEMFTHKLGLGLVILEDMRKHPEKHEKEWAIWEQNVVGVLEHGQRCAGEFRFGFWG